MRIVKLGSGQKKVSTTWARSLGTISSSGTRLWRLDVLQDPKLNALAAPSLAEADLLIVSLRCERQVPDKILALIDERLAQRVNPECALVAPFERSAPATRSSVYACLATLARQHGFDFFEQAVSDAEDQAEPSLKLVWAF